MIKKGYLQVKKVLITGANGFIAKHIAKVLKASGCFVIGTSRKPHPMENYDEVFYGILGEPLKGVFENHKVDVVIHCAYDKQDIDNKKNAEGTIIWAEQAEKSGVDLQIFMSSLSADEDAIAPYGQKKFEVEKWFIAHNHVVFRLGLVVGSGGLFGSMISMVKKMPILPLVDMGRNLTYISDVNTVSNIVRDFIINTDRFQMGKVYYLQQNEPIYIKDILKEIRKQSKTFCIFVPVPSFVLSFLIRLSELMDFTDLLGINTNNLKGLRQFNQKRFKSDLVSLGYSDIPIEILIKKVYMSK